MYADRDLSDLPATTTWQHNTRHLTSLIVVPKDPKAISFDLSLRSIPAVGFPLWEPSKLWPQTERLGAVATTAALRLHPKGISYAEAHLQPGAIVLLLVAAVVSLAATAAMWAATSWLPLRLNLVWPALAVLAFVAFGVLMVVLACIQPQVLVFDGTTLSVRGRALRRLGQSRELHLRFDSLAQPRVQAFERESQGPVHQVNIGVQGQPPLLLGAFDDTAHAQYWCDQLAPLLASTTPSQQR